MIAFHGKLETKEFYLNRVLKHRKMDEIIQGTGWENGKGCAVGCTLENYNHAQYEVELGIPEWLARLEDTIFEGLDKKVALDWPARFLDAVNVGADLDKIKKPFIIFILEQSLKYMDACEFDRDANPDVVKALEGSKAAVLQMIEAQKGNGDLTAAWSAAESARYAAWSAAWSAESAAESASSAAHAAAWSARSAAWSARSAAWSARSAAWSARSAAWSAAYEVYADKLIELIKDCK